MRLLIVLFTISVFSLPVLAQENPGNKDTLTPKEEFLTLPKAQRDLYKRMMKEAESLFSQKRIFNTLQKLDDAESIFKKDAALFSIRGNCYVEFRDFPKAIANYNRAFELAPENDGLLFNISELHFVMKNYKAALESFQKLIKRTKDKKSLYLHISEYKVLLCLIALDRMNEAQILAGKYTYMDDTPFYYYAKAALAFHAGNDDEAKQEINRAVRVFSNKPKLISIWQDTLVEFGYLKSFYGEDNPELEK